MSLTSILSYLQTLISSRFILASFLPMLAFWFVNGLTLFLLNVRFERFVRDSIAGDAGFSSVLVAAVLIGVALTAYAESVLLPALQSIMEGNWPRWLTLIFAPAQMRRYEWFDEQGFTNRQLRASLREGGQAKSKTWSDELTQERVTGRNKFTGTNNFTRWSEGARSVNRLAWRRRRALPISGDQLKAAVDALKADLAINDADKPGPCKDWRLDKTDQLLRDLIKYAENYAETEARSLSTRRRFRYGTLPVAPTRMGNVARTVQNYALERYHFNFDLLWSRLQLSVQRDKDFSQLLQGAKTQLDFLTSSAALILAWSIPWALFLYLTQGPPLAFATIALAGPLLGYLCYRLAVAQYQTLADLLRGSIDLFRFDMLTNMHYLQPASVQEEIFLWEKIDALHVLFQLDDLRYTPPRT